MNYALYDRNFERGWNEGTRHKGVIGRAVIDMEKQLTDARRRPPPVHPSAAQMK